MRVFSLEAPPRACGGHTPAFAGFSSRGVLRACEALWEGVGAVGEEVWESAREVFCDPVVGRGFDQHGLLFWARAPFRPEAGGANVVVSTGRAPGHLRSHRRGPRLR